MIAELEEVILKLEQLAEEEQQQVAKLLWQEVLWGRSLENSQSELSILAKEAVEEYKLGNTKKLDW